MLMNEIVDQISFKLGLPANSNVEDLSIEKAVLVAFQELKVYMHTPTHITVPFSTRLDLVNLGIKTSKVLYVFPANPKVGLNLTNVDSSNVFTLAASANAGFSALSGGDLTPLVEQLAMAQVSNVLSTDFQWTYDQLNQVVYCTCKQSRPSLVTIRYVPDFQDVSEIQNPTWISYLIRMGEANAKVALGRTRSKYKIEGSNVSLDGEILLQEGTAELTQIREELKPKKKRIRVLT